MEHERNRTSEIEHERNHTPEMEHDSNRISEMEYERVRIIEEVMQRERKAANWPGKEKYRGVVDEIGSEIERYKASGKPVDYDRILDGTSIPSDATWYEKIQYYAIYYYTKIRRHIIEAIERIERR